MAMFIRAKRVSDPLDDRVKARLFNNYSSGSEHEEEDSCLSDLVHAFFDFEESATSDTNDIAGGTITDNITDDDGDVSRTTHANNMLDAFEKHDPFRNRITKDLTEVLSGLNVSGSMDRRIVMTRLRDKGYNAGICTTKWEKNSGLIAGGYEYIDIIMFNDERYIVDLDFRAQFEVARATVQYEKLVATSLPSVMVGNEEEVRRVVRMMAVAANRSLKSKDLSVPPWRKRRYMVNKWFGPYRRIVNALPSPVGVAVAGRSREIKYCVTGFTSALNALQA